VFYSGAISVDPKSGQPALLPFDKEGLRLEAVLRKLTDGGGAALVVVDACPVGKGKAKELKIPAKAVLVAAPREGCAQGELALHFTEGLGSALADSDGDKAITFDELRDFVRGRMTKEGAQGPLFETGKSETGAQLTLGEGLDKK
jgi:hypothetical protein